MEVKPGYKQTEVGVIPEDWECSDFKSVTDLITCGIAATPRYVSESQGYPFLSSSNVKEGRILWDNYKWIDGNLHKQLYLNNPPLKGDILYSRVGTIGEAAVVDVEFEFSIYVSLTLIKPKRCLASSFLKHLLNSGSYKKRAHGQVYLGGGVGNLNVEVVRDYPIVVPPLPEQEAIAEALSDADALIESLEQLLAKKRQIKKGAMQELLTGKKRLPGFSGEWQTRQLGEVINHCSSGATPYRGSPDYYTGTVKWITSGELNYNVITDTIEHISEEAVQKTNLKIHPAGTFLMAITGLEAAGTRGACGIVGSPATTNQSCMAIYPSIELKTAFLYHYYVMRGNELALQYCQGTKQQSYTAKLVRLLPIDLPPTIQEQAAIATILADMDTEIAALEVKLSKARQLKQGMMQELLTGRIRLI